MKFFGHLKTVIRHRHSVFVHCCKAGIPLQGLRHDLSKFSPVEFIPGVRYFQGDKSPNVEERRLFGYSAAWLHHKGRNRHHFEYWQDLDLKTRTVQPVEMPMKYVAEMFCDRVAACKIYQGTAYSDASAWKYFDNGRSYRSIHPATSDLLESWLIMLRDEGEEKTFAHIRASLKHQ